MSTPDLPQLEPVRDDGIRSIQVGIALWALAGLVLAVQHNELADRGTQWWLAVCGAGLLIGIVQLAIFSRRRALIQARERGSAALEDSVAGDSQPAGPGSSGPDGGGPSGAGPTA